MSWDYWDRYESKLRRPTDGIRAETQSGPFGRTWWAGRWLAALEQLIDSARLSRGRSYARSGQVTKLEVGRNGVEARVQGSRVEPYKVTIRFRLLSHEKWETVADVIASQAIFAAKLLAGDMPEQIQEAFEQAGASLFPANDDDLETDCSCPDWANPCKHIAAVYYLLGERFDVDPFLIFEMRGRTRDEIIASLRARRTGESALDTPEVEEQAEEEAEIVVQLEQSLDTFWTVPEAALDMPMDFSPPDIQALPIKRLGPPPFWHSHADFTELMEQAYREIADRALKTVMGEE